MNKLYHANDHYLNIFSSEAFSIFCKLHAWISAARQFFVRKQAQEIFTATMHDVGIRCADLGHVALPLWLHFTWSGTLFLSLEADVRAASLRLCCQIHRQAKWFPSTSLGLLTSKSPVISATKQRISTSWVLTLSTSRDRVLEESSLRRATVANGCLHRRVESNCRFVYVSKTQVSIHAKLPWKSPCRFQSCPPQELCPTEETEPSRRPTTVIHFSFGRRFDPLWRGVLPTGCTGLNYAVG